MVTTFLWRIQLNTIVTMVRGMINELPLALWSEAINTAVCIKNRIPHKAVKESTPYEVIHGNKPSIRHLQPFGRKCFVHIPEEKRPSGSKLLPRAVEGKFIGYIQRPTASSASTFPLNTELPKLDRLASPSWIQGKSYLLPLPNPIPNTHQYLLLHLSGPETKNFRLISWRTNFTVKQKNMSSPEPEPQDRDSDSDTTIERAVRSPGPSPSPQPPQVPEAPRETRTRSGRIVRPPQHYSRVASLL
jgi:hypothetical protein